MNKKQKRSRRPVTSFARFHISVCKALAIARRKGEGSTLVNPFTSIGHGGYVECIIVSRITAIFINGARDDRPYLGEIVESRRETLTSA